MWVCREVWSAMVVVDLGGKLIPVDRVTKLKGLFANRGTTQIAFPWFRAFAVLLVVGAYRSVRLRLRVAVRRDELDRALAGGVHPDQSSELALRAARLVRYCDRQSLARSLRLVLGQVEGAPMLVRVSPIEIQHAAIRTDRGALVSLIERLEDPLPVLPEGAAIAERLMSDRHSPLFVPAEPGTIRRLARLAVAAMEPPT